MHEDKKTILITGGSGFLGRHLGVALAEKYRVILGARNNKQNVAASQVTGCVAAPLDVSNIDSVRDVVTEFKPDYIIHAAATKFVDLAEQYPMECVDVNIRGSQNVARVAMDTAVQAVIGISTDKAAPPVRNIYGMSKATMERLFCLLDGKTETIFTCVRYGNVAWSTGSVLPIWKAMWEKTRIIGTTGPEMRRFFFTVDSAVELVITALKHINDVRGQVLSREMKAAQIEDILQTWVAHKGGAWERISGRPGERLDEFLIGESELPFATECLYNGIRHFLVSPNKKSENPLSGVVSSATVERLSEAEILALLAAEPTL